MASTLREAGGINKKNGKEGMKARFLSVLVLAGGSVMMVGGCANVGTEQSAKNVSITTFASSQDPFFPKRRAEGAGETKVRAFGQVETSEYPLMAVRKCNQDQTSCSWGVVKLVGTTELKEVSPDGVTLAIGLSYDLGRKQTMAALGHTVTSEISAEVPVLSGHREFSKVVRIPYGQMRRVSFDYGVDFNVCAVPADKNLMPSDARCSLDGIQTGATAQSSLPLL